MVDLRYNPPSSPYVAYLEESRRPVASLFFLLPFLLVYHIGIWCMHLWQTNVANGADVVLTKLVNIAYYGALWLYGQLFPSANADSSAALWFLQMFGSLFGMFLLVGMLLIRQHMRAFPWRVSPRTIGLMFCESVVFALPPFAISWGVGMVFSLSAGAGDPGGWLGGIVLSLGAGIYEEFLFRMLLMGGMLWVMQHVMRLKGGAPLVIAIIAQALAFSAFHYLPWSGESFDLQVFAFRTLAGVYFAYLYQERKFGIAAGSHAIYDVMAVTLNDLF